MGVHISPQFWHYLPPLQWSSHSLSSQSYGVPTAPTCDTRPQIQVGIWPTGCRSVFSRASLWVWLAMVRAALQNGRETFHLLDHRFIIKIQLSLHLLGGSFSDAKVLKCSKVLEYKCHNWGHTCKYGTHTQKVVTREKPELERCIGQGLGKHMEHQPFLRAIHLFKSLFHSTQSSPNPILRGFYWGFIM